METNMSGFREVELVLPLSTTCCMISHCVSPPRHCSSAHGNTQLALQGMVEYPLDGPARAAFRTRDGKVS